VTFISAKNMRWLLSKSRSPNSRLNRRSLLWNQRKQEAEQARQIAQGQADAAVIAAQGAAEARLIEANAEAEANRLLAQSITPQLMQYQYVLKLAPGCEHDLYPKRQSVHFAAA
jgi:hypothetical protein